VLASSSWSTAVDYKDGNSGYSTEKLTDMESCPPRSVSRSVVAERRQEKLVRICHCRRQRIVAASTILISMLLLLLLQPLVEENEVDERTTRQPQSDTSAYDEPNRHPDISLLSSNARLIDARYHTKSADST